MTGDRAAIKKLADSVGFNYNYIPAKSEYAHPTAIVVLSANGLVVSYIHGLSFEAADLNSRVVSAGARAADRVDRPVRLFLFPLRGTVRPDRHRLQGDALCRPALCSSARRSAHLPAPAPTPAIRNGTFRNTMNSMLTRLWAFQQEAAAKVARRGGRRPSQAGGL